MNQEVLSPHLLNSNFKLCEEAENVVGNNNNPSSYLAVQECNIYSQVFEMVKEAVQNKTQGGMQRRAVLEPNLTISSPVIYERLETNHTGILDSSSPVLPPNSSTGRVSSLPCSQSSIRNTPTIPHQPKSSRQVECYPVCSKALRFAKILQDKKSNLKNKELVKDSGKAKSKTKKRNSKEGKRNIQLSSSSIDESSQDEDAGDFESNLDLIGASLGITLDGKPARSKNDVLEIFSMKLIIVLLYLLQNEVCILEPTRNGYKE
ncbi:hypothetical protein Tco_1530884 [Tanacetum coccineum]